MGSLLAKAFFKKGQEELSSVERDLEEIQLKTIDGDLEQMASFMEDQKVILVVNVATK